MYKCNECNISISGDNKNCPLCGRHSQEKLDSNINHVESTYGAPILKQQNRKLIRNIFLAISTLLLSILLVTSIVLKNYSIIAYSTLVIAFVWMSVLRFVFNPRNLNALLSQLTATLIVFSAGILIYFKKYNITIDYLIPLLLMVLNIVNMMIVFITGKWYKYAHSSIIVSILELTIGVIAISLKLTNTLNINAIVPIISLLLGLSTIAFSLVFGRKVMFTEFKKRYHM